MFGSKGLRYLLILLFGIMLVCPAYSEEFDYRETQKRISVQEEFGDYMVMVQDKIAKTWTPPDVIEEGHATVIFKVDKNGNLISSYIKESSGNSIYDTSALESVKKASPYMQFPENASRDYITVMYSFDSSVVSANEVKNMVAQAEKYINVDNQKARNILDQAIRTIEGDPASYFLYARRYKLDKLMGDMDSARIDMEKCKERKIAYDKRRIMKCKEALMQEETPFAYFTLANAYELAGDYDNALANIDKAISMTELNHAYKRYRAEMIMRKDK